MSEWTWTTEEQTDLGMKTTEMVFKFKDGSIIMDFSSKVGRGSGKMQATLSGNGVSSLLDWLDTLETEAKFQEILDEFSKEQIIEMIEKAKNDPWNKP